MGNSCDARSLVPERQIKLPSKEKAVPRVHTSISSGFVPRMNALLAQSEDCKQNECPKTSSELKYIEPKVLEEEKSIGSTNKFIFTALLRTQLKGKIFFNQNDIKSEISLLNHRQNVQQVTRDLQQNDIKQISAILDNHFLFLQLNPTERMETIKQMRLFSSQPGNYIFKQGQDAQSFFIISQGEVEVIIDGEVKKKLTRKQSFGEIALLFGSQRTASVRSVTKCLFWGIDRLTFKRIVDDINLRTEKQNRQFLDKTEFFKYLTPIQQQSVMSLIVTLKYQQGDSIVNNGQQFYIIKSGQVGILKQNGEEAILDPGCEFGDKSFKILESIKALNVKAKTDCVIICINKNQIIEALSSTIQNVIMLNRIRRAMEKSKRFRVILHKSMQYFANDFTVKSVTKGEKILKKGHIMKNFYIPIDVQLTSVDKKYPIQEIIQQNLLIEGHPLQHGITVEESGSLLVIKATSDIFNQVISFKSEINPNNVKLDNIQIIRKIGSGQFGDVYAGLHLSSNSLVAVKSISKKTVQKYNIQKQIVNEQNVMKTMNHPFIVKYFNTFIAKREIYFVIQYIPGKEFFDVIRQIGLLKNHEAQFFAGQVLMALEYMHNLQIVYRDLKPENIMVDTAGYLKLIDMGTAKLLRKQNYYKTRTVIGTPHYMAPEVISGKGYGFFSDLWSFGVLVYELICGYLPYEEKNNDPFQIYKQIMNKSLQFPGYIKDLNSKQIIMKLLNKTPENRMEKGYYELKKMGFFQGLDWTLLQKKKIPSVYKMIDNIGIDLSKIHRESLQTIPEYFQKLAIKEGSTLSKKQISWEASLMDNF